MLLYNSSDCLCRVTSSSTISSSISFSGFFSRSMRTHDSANRGAEGSTLYVLYTNATSNFLRWSSLAMTTLWPYLSKAA